jgi:O-antigen/teichoic acid export membrane protein
MATDLKQKAITGIFWRGLETVGTRGVQFIVGVILARILLPEQFGLIAILLIFSQLAQAFVDSGFPGALIQKKNISFTDECSVFYFNIFIAIVVYFILFFSAPFIALFYEQPILVPGLRILSLTLVIGAFSQVQQTLLSKQIDFKRQFKVGFVCTVVSGVIGIVMAYSGFGVWALIVQQLTQVTIRTIMFWFVSAWRPGLVFCFKSLKSLFKFGSKLLFTGLLDTFYNNIYGLIIGKMFSPSDLGFYNRGRTVPNQFMSSVTGTVAVVMFPVFSTIQDDSRKLKTAAKRTLTTICIIVFPIMFGLTAVAEPFVRVLLTDKWLPCVPYLRIMCLVFATWPIHVINLQIVGAIGRSDVVLKLEVIKKIMITIAIIITFKFGVFAMVGGQLATAIIAVFINSHYCGKFISYTTFEQLKDILPATAVSVVMGIAVYFIGTIDLSNIYIQLTMQIFVGIIVYIIGCMLMKIDSFYELLNILKQKIYPEIEK